MEKLTLLILLVAGAVLVALNDDVIVQVIAIMSRLYEIVSQGFV